MDVENGGYARGRQWFRFAVTVSVLLASASVFLSVVLFAHVSNEAQDRRDQECSIFEQRHLDTVGQLAATYQYLETLPSADYGTNLTKAVIRGLASQEQRARGLSVPIYCDAPGVGLDEPNPTLPARRDFSALLKRP